MKKSIHFPKPTSLGLLLCWLILNHFSAFAAVSPSALSGQAVALATKHDPPGTTKALTPVNASYTIHIPGWRYPGNTNTDTISLDPGSSGAFLAAAYNDQVFPAACDNSISKINRNWSVIDWSGSGNPVEKVLPALDLNNDGVVGDAYDMVAQGDSIYAYLNGQPVQTLGLKADQYAYLQVIRYNYNDTSTLSFKGRVFMDTLANCSYDSQEPPLAGWKVKAVGETGNVYSGYTNANGLFDIPVCLLDTVIEVSLDVPFNFAGSCASTYTAHLTPGVPSLQDIPVSLNLQCNLLGVDLATPYLRPCFNGHYNLHYCNYSGQTVSGTYVDVKLDSFINFLSATLPGTLMGSNTYRFQTGTLSPGASGAFEISFLLNCNAPLGLTHCSTAHIYPEDDCAGSASWSGSDLRVTGYCDGDSVRMTIQNIGNGNMANPLDFVVTEDLIMYSKEPYQLNSFHAKEVVIPANGSTWRLETTQEPGHPWGGVQATAIEGCGGNTGSGFVNLFPMNSPDPFMSTDCTQSTGSYDPNDKQAFPVGYGSQHFIKANSDIEYLIRFQNTGTDTAFTVVLLDTLPSSLRARSARPGAAGHAYDFDVLPGNVLRFRFDHILLPDSNKNEAASHGFVKFRVSQQPDNPDGTVINNRAAIYFDYNAPVLTNTTWHTIGKDFVLLSAIDDVNAPAPLQVYPNPSDGRVYFELPGQLEGGRFLLTDPVGKTILEQVFSGKTYQFEKTNRSSGVYFYQIRTGDGLVFSGKVLLR